MCGFADAAGQFSADRIVDLGSGDASFSYDGWIACSGSNRSGRWRPTTRWARASGQREGRRHVDARVLGGQSAVQYW
jgi:hypothetical protein